MATPPINVDTQVAAIRSAVYGEEVRGSIADAILAIEGNYNEYTGANGAIRTANEAYERAVTAQDSAANSATEAARQVGLAQDEVQNAAHQVELAHQEVENATYQVTLATDEADRAQTEAENAADSQAAAKDSENLAYDYAELARQMGHGAKMFTVEFVLNPYDWVHEVVEEISYYLQTVSVTGMAADSVGIVAISNTATQAERMAASKSEVRLIDQGTNFLTFKAKKQPTVSIPMVVNF